MQSHLLGDSPASARALWWVRTQHSGGVHLPASRGKHRFDQSLPGLGINGTWMCHRFGSGVPTKNPRFLVHSYTRKPERNNGGRSRWRPSRKGVIKRWPAVAHTTGQRREKPPHLSEECVFCSHTSGAPENPQCQERQHVPCRAMMRKTRFCL